MIVDEEAEADTVVAAAVVAVAEVVEGWNWFGPGSVAPVMREDLGP